MDMISPSIAALTPSLTLKVTNRAKAMKASGEEVYGLAGGEPEMDTPENIKQAAIAALNNGATKYTPSAGLPALRQAIAEKLKRENNLEYDFTQITVGAGAKHACFNAIMATVSEGDEVIIPAPLLGQLSGNGPHVRRHPRHRGNHGGKRMEAYRRTI